MKTSNFNYNRPISVLLIRGKNIVIIFVHRGLGPSLFRGGSFAGARSRSRLTNNAMKKGLQMADEVADHFFLGLTISW
jgi:hypothetical protein